jgi:hypothetical protein
MPFIGRGSRSCARITKLCVPVGALLHERGGDTLAGVPEHEYLAGKFPMSVNAGLLIIIGGPA